MRSAKIQRFDMSLRQAPCPFWEDFNPLVPNIYPSFIIILKRPNYFAALTKSFLNIIIYINAISDELTSVQGQPCYSNNLPRKNVLSFHQVE